MTLEEFAMWINFYLDNGCNKNANVYVGKKLLDIKGFTPLYDSYPLDKLLWLELETQDDKETSDSDSNKMEKVELTEEQKRNLERQANNYSYDFFERMKNGYSTEFAQAKFGALAYAVESLGYEFVKDGKAQTLGVEYINYKLVEIK